jgi:hypothetical protein
VAYRGQSSEGIRADWAGEKKDLVQNADAHPQAVFVINLQARGLPLHHRGAPTLFEIWIICFSPEVG